MPTPADGLKLIDATCPFVAACDIETDQDYLRVYRGRQRLRLALMNTHLDSDARRVGRRLEAAATAALSRYEDRQGDAGRVGKWIPTVSGRRLWLEDPRPGEIEPFDIAYGLARVARFNCMTVGPVYTVAQHSVMGSYLVPPEFVLHFLLHDAHEYVGQDVTSPLKAVIGDRYAAVEAGLKYAVAGRFDIEWTDDALGVCKAADFVMLATEVRDVTPWGVVNGDLPYPPLTDHLYPMPEALAFCTYADRLNQVFGDDLVEVSDECREQAQNDMDWAEDVHGVDFDE
jgi:hypothetical protein